MIRKGEFGWEGYFDQLIESLSGSSDYYLLANDFPSYLETQACIPTTFPHHPVGYQDLCRSWPQNKSQIA